MPWTPIATTRSARRHASSLTRAWSWSRPLATRARILRGRNSTASSTRRASSRRSSPSGPRTASAPMPATTTWWLPIRAGGGTAESRRCDAAGEAGAPGPDLFNARGCAAFDCGGSHARDDHRLPHLQVGRWAHHGPFVRYGREPDTKYQKVYGLGVLLADGTTEALGMLVADGTLMSDGVLAKATTYTYRVRAFNLGGSSSYSNSASGTTKSR